jgi:anhydro-N-acetylmuramic acid kinase
VVFLNLGGVGNLTWVDPRIAAPEQEGALLAFDTGPANAPVNDLMQARRGLPFDEGGKLAGRGRVEQGALELFLAEAFFARMPPKSLDRNDFAEMIALVGELSDADAAATLTAMCAAGVAQGIEHCPTPPSRVLVAGGGRHNPVLMRMLQVSLDCPVVPVEDVGLDGDMLEAQAFAYLAVRVARGLPTSCPGTTGVRAAVGGGTISVPQAPQDRSLTMTARNAS